MTDGNFVIAEEDWSLHRKGFDDQKRHQDKIKEVIKKKLPEIVSEENIIMSRGKEIIRIPIRSLDEYKIRYSQSKNKHVGQGKGDSQVGDVVAKDPQQASKGQKGEEAGNQPGADYYEAEVDFEEVEEAFFAQLSLPNLMEKEKDNIIITDVEFRDIRKKGLTGNIDKKRTMMASYKRNALEGNPSFAPIYPDDLRFKTWDNVEKPESKAVIIAIMDTSGSMGKWEKYMARSFYFWMVRFLRKKYETVEVEFIAHHTEAKVVDEESFFTKGESGGTICSSAYRKALELIDDKYPASRYNIYPFHFSDGDNLTSDNRRAVEAVYQLLEHASMFCYGEVNQYNRYSTLMQAFKAIDHPRFMKYVLKNKEDVFYAMKHFFHEDHVGVQ
ncbi:sporulation protein YhbH [Gracilibacillus sp. S3-1-1]|uniref:Sporulation protein YhbH n=1 Tax=Gracilibacillus pellucidus TaxID=3095368 RepID=A0ACC6M447_9BACI|nr:sporulation protein YhbH [Gracilibacillus sp. S3-1-1]MDX8045650.1 sporulation protein YhbH [Gracilibacillus sp. S3-1-1]